MSGATLEIISMTCDNCNPLQKPIQIKFDGIPLVTQQMTYCITFEPPPATNFDLPGYIYIFEEGNYYPLARSLDIYLEERQETITLTLDTSPEVTVNLTYKVTFNTEI